MNDVDLSAIRNAIVQRVQKNGLRRIARQVGMSPSGLSKFLHGAAPYEKTRLKMAAWSARLQAGDERSAEDVLIDSLVSTLPKAGQEETREALIRVLDRARRRWLPKR
jgi:hypothetical protein